MKMTDADCRAALVRLGGPVVPEHTPCDEVVWVARDSDLYVHTSAGWFWARYDYSHTVPGAGGVYIYKSWVPCPRGPLSH